MAIRKGKFGRIEEDISCFKFASLTTFYSHLLNRGNVVRVVLVDKSIRSSSCDAGSQTIQIT